MAHHNFFSLFSANWLAFLGKRMNVLPVALFLGLEFRVFLLPDWRLLRVTEASLSCYRLVCNLNLACHLPFTRRCLLLYRQWLLTRKKKKKKNILVGPVVLTLHWTQLLFAIGIVSIEWWGLNITTRSSETNPPTTTPCLWTSRCDLQ